MVQYFKIHGECQNYTKGQHFAKIHWARTMREFKITASNTAGKICESILTPSTHRILLGHQKRQTIFLPPEMQSCGWRTSKPLAIVGEWTPSAEFSTYI